MVLWEVSTALGRPLEPSEYSAVLRAVRRLAESGRAQRCYVWGRDPHGSRKPFVFLYPVGASEPTGRARLSVERG